MAGEPAAGAGEPEEPGHSNRPSSLERTLKAQALIREKVRNGPKRKKTIQNRARKKTPQKGPKRSEMPRKRSETVRNVIDSFAADPLIDHNDMIALAALHSQEEFC